MSIPVIRGNGYDGQFYFRLALDPLNFSRVAHAIQLDSAVWFECITYPTLAWALAGGQAPMVEWTLVAVNVTGLGVLGYCGGILATDGGRPAHWGLLLPGYFGFIWSLSRDLTEIVEASLLVAALLALRGDRPWVAGVAFTGAVLSRETALIAVACVAWIDISRRWRRRGARGRRQLPLGQVAAWMLPLMVFVVWQAAVDGTNGSRGWPRAC